MVRTNPDGQVNTYTEVQAWRLCDAHYKQASQKILPYNTVHIFVILCAIKTKPESAMDTA